MQKYQYEPVSEDAFEIRFLILLPGEREDPVQGLLLERTLTKEDFPVYEALSYAWGSQDDPMEVAIRSTNIREACSLVPDAKLDPSFRGTLRPKRVKIASSFKLHATSKSSSRGANEKVLVTQNLGRALPYLRYRDKPRILWIDAICVNQEDLPERSRQVQRMADVYRLASRAVVWLGEESDTSKLAIALLKEIASNVDYNESTYSLSALSESPSDTHWADNGSRVILGPIQISSLTDFFSRPWFHRLWVLQEIHLASHESNLNCGTDEIPWQEFRRSVAVLNANGVLITDTTDQNFIDDYDSVSRKVISICEDISSFAFEDTLQLTKHSQCSDQKDRIYALLSLSGTDRIDITPDYTRHIEWIFEDATRSLFNKSLSMRLLSYCELNPKRVSKLPSWVPDFSIPRSSSRLYNICNSSTLHQPLRIDNGYLKAQGIRVSTIRNAWTTQLVPISSRSDTDVEVMRLLSELDKERVHHNVEANMEDFLSSLLVSGFAEKCYPASSVRPYISAIDEVKEHFSASQSGSHSNEVGKYIDAIYNALLGRKLFTTTEGHIGLCPQFAELGDIIVLLVGCGTPLVLRLTGNGKFLVVGEAYYHGIMNGERFLGPLSPDVDCVQRLGFSFPLFVNRVSEKTQCEDPRLGELPSGWSRVGHEREEEFTIFRDNNTEEVYYSDIFDPRTFPEELEKRGVKLENFTLV